MIGNLLREALCIHKVPTYVFGDLMTRKYSRKINKNSFSDFPDSDSEGNTELTSDDEEDDGDCDTEEYLAALGTRPPLPAKFRTADSMMSPVIQLFCCCTSEDPKERPSAKDIVAALQPEIIAKNVQI